jgi:hypothetical protein
MYNVAVACSCVDRRGIKDSVRPVFNFAPRGRNLTPRGEVGPRPRSEIGP